MYTQLLLNKEQHNSAKTWLDVFPDRKVKLVTLRSICKDVHKSWIPLFDELCLNEKMLKIEERLSEELEISDVVMYPPPELVFNAFKMCSLDKLKVVFVGQDPYFNKGEAMGLSFSVPFGMRVPSSLDNMYRNLRKFGHHREHPGHGNLEFWAMQGCLMLNAALTVLGGADNKNCHSGVWRWFTDRVIRYISEKCEGVVFVLWGSSAFEKSSLIDQDKHELVVSSHPSGLSADKPMKIYAAFNEQDHFGIINKHLERHKKSGIIWMN